MRISCGLILCTLLVSTSWALEPDDPALVGVWLFDEGEGDTVGDASGNENEGFLVTEDDFEWGEGKFGTALTSFGPGSIDVEDSDSLATIEEALTVAAWFRIDADSDTGVRKQGAFLLEDQSASEPVPDGFSFRVWTSQGITPGFYGTTELEQEVWYHIAGTYDGENVQMYVNGEPEYNADEGEGSLDAGGGEWEPVWGGDVQPGSPLQLKYGPEPLSGGTDEVVIFNRALSQSDIVELMGGWESLGNTNPGDINGDGVCDAADIDALSAAILAGETGAKFDTNGDGSVNNDDHKFLVSDIKNTFIGDSNLDGEFSSSDFVTVFQAGKYETNQPAGWAQGDWNGDGLANSSDFVVAFQEGAYEQGPNQGAVASVPEPSSFVLLLIGVIAMLRRR